MNSPAFKEWQVIISALASGAQTLILRKGGLAEGSKGFRVSADRFWLFPTHFHAQREKTLPTASAWFSEPVAGAGRGAAASVSLECFATLSESLFVSDWPRLRSLAPYHFWTEATVRERFDWSQPPGLHVLIVRVFRLSTPQILPVTAEMGGCKSWIELPCALPSADFSPVLDDGTFAARCDTLRQQLQGSS